MPVSRKRKNRGKGAEAKERRRRVRQRNRAVREKLRPSFQGDSHLRDELILRGGKGDLMNELDLLFQK